MNPSRPSRPQPPHRPLISRPAGNDLRDRMRAPSAPQVPVQSVRPAQPTAATPASPVVLSAPPVPPRPQPQIALPPLDLPPAATAKTNKKRRTSSRLPVKKLAASLAAIAVAVGIGGGAFYLSVRQQPALPKTVTAKTNYALFSPTDASVINIDKKTVQYDAKTQLLTYSATTKQHEQLIFSQQATPSSFVDVPQAYDKLVSSLQSYSSFDSVNGRVNLTHPKELKGEQAAVLNNKGTLMFVRAKQNISDDGWRQIFNNLHVTK